MKRYLCLIVVTLVALLGAEVAQSRGFGGGVHAGGVRSGDFEGGGVRYGGYEGGRYRGGGYDGGGYHYRGGGDQGGSYDSDRYRRRNVNVYDPNYVVMPTDDGYGYTDDDNNDSSNGD
jgi:hypothetical protein